jgi:hypothetical protein
MGSGLFAAFVGVVFLAALIVSFSTGLHFDQIPPLEIVRAWFCFVAAVLIFWGVNRVLKANKKADDRKNLTVGQETINLVIGIVAATFALLELVNHHHPHH